MSRENDEKQDRATGSTANGTKVGRDGEDSLWGWLSEAQSSTTRQRNQDWEAAGQGRWAEWSVASGPVGSGAKTESPSPSPRSRLLARALSRPRVVPFGARIAWPLHWSSICHWYDHLEGHEQVKGALGR